MGKQINIKYLNGEMNVDLLSFVINHNINDIRLLVQKVIAISPHKHEIKQEVLNTIKGIRDADIFYNYIDISTLKKVLNKFGLGKLSYVISGVIQLFTWKPQDALLWVDDAAEPMHLKRFLFIATHVHPYEGGGFPFCPDAQNGDGYIDLCVVSGLHLIQLFPLIPLAKIGKHVGKKGVQIIRCKKARIQVDNPVAFHTDGESHEDQTEVTVTSNAYGYHLIS